MFSPPHKVRESLQKGNEQAPCGICSGSLEHLKFPRQEPGTGVSQSTVAFSRERKVLEKVKQEPESSESPGRCEDKEQHSRHRDV